MALFIGLISLVPMLRVGTHCGRSASVHCSHAECENKDVVMCKNEDIDLDKIVLKSDTEKRMLEIASVLLWCDPRMTLNSKQSKTLEKIFERPTHASIVWSDIMNLFKGCGAEIIQRQGSRVCMKLDKQRAVFHSPHPQKEAVKGAVEDIRSFLKRAGIQP